VITPTVDQAFHALPANCRAAVANPKDVDRRDMAGCHAGAMSSGGCIRPLRELVGCNDWSIACRSCIRGGLAEQGGGRKGVLGRQLEQGKSSFRSVLTWAVEGDISTDTHLSSTICLGGETYAADTH